MSQPHKALRDTLTEECPDGTSMPLLGRLCPPQPQLELGILTLASDYSMLAKTSVHHFNGNNVSCDPP
jgi:hypothetical protein